MSGEMPPARGEGDPDVVTEAEVAEDKVAELDEVPSLDDDRIGRTFLALVEATVRTSAYRGTPTLAFKFDPSLVPDLPAPRPAHEIFVCSQRVEGVHLRGGPIARGGLRWSDRPEDYRTEVLGLVKAQMVTESVPSKASCCRITAGRGLPVTSPPPATVQISPRFTAR